MKCNGEKCLFSIIVPIYNVAPYLQECLESISRQKTDDYEVICIDDGSTDKSLEILIDMAKKDKKITVIKNEKNRGLSYSRNIGVANAKGKYILYVDSDDVITEDYLLGIKELCKDEDYDIIGINFSSFTEEVEAAQDNKINNVRDFNRNFKKHEAFIALIENKDLSIGACFRLYKRSFLMAHNITFIEGILHEDLPYTFKALLSAGSVRMVHQNYYRYRKRAGSITTMKGNENHIKGRFIGYLDSLAFWAEMAPNEVLDRYIVRYFEEYYLGHIYFALTQHKIGQVNFDNQRVQYQWNHLIYWKNGRQLNKELLCGFKDVIIYGAGVYGKMFAADLMDVDIGILGFAVTGEAKGVLLNHRIRNIDAYRHHQADALVVVAVSEKYQSEILQNLRRYDFKHVYTFGQLYLS